MLNIFPVGKQKLLKMVPIASSQWRYLDNGQYLNTAEDIWIPASIWISPMGISGYWMVSEYRWRYPDTGRYWPIAISGYWTVQLYQNTAGGIWIRAGIHLSSRIRILLLLGGWIFVFIFAEYCRIVVSD